jgi:hypothetical protein
LATDARGLKRSLHEAIGEINPAQVREVAGATFEQDRGNLTLGDVLWAKDNYLPRLVYGCLMHSLIIDLQQVPPAGPFAVSLAEYKRTRKIPDAQDRRNWANAAIERIKLIRTIWTEPPFNTLAGEILYNFATTELDIDRSAFDCIIDGIVNDPTQDIQALSSSCGYLSDRNAGAYVAAYFSR